MKKDDAGHVFLDGQKGSFTSADNVTPYYTWWNGETRFLTASDKIDPSAPVMMTDYQGSREDGNIYPFKYFTGKTPYNSVNDVMAIPNLFPNDAEDTDAYWKSYNWNAALASGMAYAGYEYSGEYVFVDTVFMWVQNHQVVPSATAVQCQECHTENGRLDFAALGFSEVEVTKLTVFPPADPEPTAVPATEEPAPAPEPVTAPEQTAETPVEESASSGSNVIILIVVALVVVLAVAYFAMRRKTA